MPGQVVVVKDTTGQPIYLWWSFPNIKSLYLPVVVNSSAAASRLGSVPGQEVLAWDPAGLWAYGWHTPVPLGDMDFTSGMTLVPRSLDSLSVLGVAGNILYERIWSEQEGWGSWQEITPQYDEGGPGHQCSGVQDERYHAARAAVSAGSSLEHAVFQPG
jgi:hypothetical protein